MNSGPLLFLGIFLSLASSFWGLVLVPQLQIGRQEQVKIESTGEFYPPNRPGLAAEGAEVYRNLGCAECHTQQVRPKGQGSDYERGWGQRRSVAQDYLQDYPVLLGSLRVGPDLANVGARQPDAAVQLQHLYKPKLTQADSSMPPYPFLFEKRKLVAGQKPSPEALQIPGAPTDIEIVPKPEAHALVAYLLSLRQGPPLFEAPLPIQPTNAPPAEAATDTPPATPAPAPAVPAQP
jgi:cytochrome c oxidase cbb3-type subunit 2